MDELNFTNAEKETREFMFRMGREAYVKHCLYDFNDANDIIPKWFEPEKFKRGQQYFQDNRYGILTSNFHGLVTLLSEPQGQTILHATGKSSTAEMARKRYDSTLLHLLAWYDIELLPDSGLVNSINKVRKLHFNASKNCENKKLGFISQAEVSVTGLGFMGLALIRPHHFGIRHDNVEDLEAFIHVWAVLIHMLGVEDQYNMCLYSLETVKLICNMLLRYLFIPYIQLETPTFKKMVHALCEGLSSSFPFISYDTLLFEVKRTIGIPGYQYGIDYSKDVICKQLFTEKEFHGIQEIVHRRQNHDQFPVELCGGIPIIEILDNIEIYRSTDDEKINGKSTEINSFYKLLGINGPEQLKVTPFDEESFRKLMNDSQFYKLNMKSQYIINRRLDIVKIREYRIGRYIIESGLNLLIYRIKRLYETKKK